VDHRFYPSVAKGIADQILQEELGGQAYDEEDSKNWCYLISDKIRAAVRGEECLVSAHYEFYR
jgi:hypothetical protein